MSILKCFRVGFPRWVSALGFILLLVTGLNACKTKQIGYRDPEFESFTPKKILVYVVMANSTMRVNIENDFVDATISFKKQKYQAEIVQSHKLFPPTRVYTQEEIGKICKENGIDSILQIWLSEKETTIEGFSYFISANVTPVKNGMINAVLFDATTYKKIWVTNYSFRSPIRKFEKQLTFSMVKVISSMKKDKLLIEK